MPDVLPKIGFKDVVKSVNLATGSGMIRGDVLLGNGHTAFCCGNGKLVHASINEKGTVTGGSLEIRLVEKSASAAITISHGFMCTVIPE